MTHYSAVFSIGNPMCDKILAALLYRARLILFEYALPAIEHEQIENPYHQFVQTHHQWLVDGHPTPVNYLNNLLAYAVGADSDAGGEPGVQWSKNRQVLNYQARRLALYQLRQFVLDSSKSAESLLFSELMFLSESTAAYELNMHQLVDDMNESSVGYSFVSDPRNYLLGGRERMPNRLNASSHSLL